MKQVTLPFSYCFRFARRRGWRTKAEESLVLPMDLDAPFAARTLSLAFTEGDPDDVKQFIDRYEVEIRSPNPWYRGRPTPMQNMLAPDIQIASDQMLHIYLFGKPFTPLKQRLVWMIQINGVKLFTAYGEPS